MEPLHPDESSIRSYLRRASTSVPFDQWLDDKKDQSENQPQQHHCMHPPELDGSKAIPKIEPINHIKAARSYQKGRDPCLPDEAPLDRLKECQTILLGASDYRQNDGRHHCNTTNPNDHCEDMNRSSNRDIIHGECRV